MKALIVYNNSSGKSRIKKKINYVIENLKGDYDVVNAFESYAQGSIVEYLMVNGENYDLVVAAGGDGTVHEAVNGLMKLTKRPTLAFIPAGTCNDAAKTLGFSRRIKKTLGLIKENNIVSIDVSKVNDSYFIYGFAAGALTEISYIVPRKPKKMFGKLAYYFYVFKSISKSKPLNLKIKTDDFEEEKKYAVLLSTNSRFLAGFKLKRSFDPCLNDGKIQVVLINHRNKLLDLILMVRLLVFGEFKSKHAKYLDTSKMHITLNEDINFNLDGECFADQRDINIEVLPNSLNVITSNKISQRYFNK